MTTTSRLMRALLIWVVVAMPLPSASAVAAPPVEATFPTQAGQPRAGDVVPGRLLVRFEPGATAAQRGRAHEVAHARKSRSIDLVPGLEVLDVAADSEALADRLRDLPGVAYSEPDRYVSIDLTPNDPQFPSQWNLSSADGSDINAPEAWDITTGDPGTVVAVIDSGVQLDHPDLAANIWTNTAEIANGLDDDGNGYVDDLTGWDFWDDDANPTDLNGHGTHVAGTIAAVGNNGVGVAGVAYSSRIMALRVIGQFGTGSISDGVAALDYAWRNGARVANLSWGYAGGVSQTLKDAIATAGQHGVLVVAAAGNAAADIDVDPFYPAGFDLPGLVTVAAVDDADQLASFSNIGRAGVDLAAPGVNITSTYPNGYALASGTSMAAPHVSGVAALLFSEHPDWTASAARVRLIDSARPLAALAGKTVSGGTLDAAAALLGPADMRPAVTIVTPKSGKSVLPGTTVSFSATATDVEDGNIGASIMWWSSLQGSLGSGPSFSRSDLVNGTHVITAMAEDSAGHRPIRAIQLTVGPVLTKITSSAGDLSPVVAVEGDGTVKVAFSRYGTGTYVATRGGGGSWTTTLASPSSDDRWLDAAIGGDGKVEVAVQRKWSSVAVYADPGIMLLDHDGATWRTERATESCQDGQEGCGEDWTPSLAIGDDGREHVLLARTEPFMGEAGLLVEGIYHVERTPQGGWASELVAAGTDLTTPWLAIDSSGDLHAVWVQFAGATPGVWYATNASGAWVATRLSTTAAEYRPHVLVDSIGRVRVLVASDNGLSLQTKTGGSWDGWSVVSPGRYRSIDAALDGADGLHVSIGVVDANDTADGVAYATDSTGAWTTTSVTGGQVVDPSIALDGLGHVHIAFESVYPVSGVRYATNQSGSWVVGAVVPNYVMLAPDFAVDGRGVAHAALPRYGTAPGIYYGVRAADAWSVSRVTTLPPDADGGTSLAVNSIGEVSLTYGTMFATDGTTLPTPGVFFATNASGAWISTRIGNNGGPDRRPIVLDSAGRAHVVFNGTEGGIPGLFHATNASGHWTSERLTSITVTDPTLAIDAAGKLHIAFIRFLNGQGRIAYLTNASGTWVTTNVSSGGTDWNPSIAVDAANRPSIAYWRSGGGVRLVELRSTGWAARIISPDEAALMPDLTIDSSGQRHVLYSLATYDYARCAVPLCPDYPGVRHATGGATGAFTDEVVSSNGGDVWGTLNRGRDGSLGAAFTRGGVGVFDVRLARGPTKATTSLVDLSPATITKGSVVSPSAQLMAGVTALAGRSLVFKIDGVAVGNATTSASGIATLTWTANVSTGVHKLTIGFVGATGYLAARLGPRSITVQN